jgi:hypothetical protein
MLAHAYYYYFFFLHFEKFSFLSTTDKAAGKSDITDDNKVKSSESVEAEVAAGSSQNKMEVTAESGICLFRILDLYCGYNYNLYISMYTNTR